MFYNILINIECSYYVILKRHYPIYIIYSFFLYNNNYNKHLNLINFSYILIYNTNIDLTQIINI